MKKALLQAISIAKYYQGIEEVQVLKNLNLEVFEGESLAIMGRSGEGKSTLLHILSTLEEPTSGQIYYNGEQVQKNELSLFRNKNLGFVFQNFNLLEDYTVLENVLLPCKIARKETHSSSKAFKRALELLEKVSLLQRKDFLAKHLSGGEKQRVAIARALINDPGIIFADEPSGNVDSLQAQTIHELLLNCVKNYKKSLIVVTHDHALATLCDKILYLKDGVLHLTPP